MLAAMHHDSVPLFQTTQSLRQRQRGWKSLPPKEGHGVTFVSLLKQGKFTLETVSFHLFKYLLCIIKISPNQSYKTLLFISKPAKSFQFSQKKHIVRYKKNMTFLHCLAGSLHFEACKQKHNENKSSGSIISFVRHHLWLISLQLPEEDII